MSRVLVFGCGPAGLMATQAAAELGHDVIVVSRKRKSEMFGCQYLHAPIPGVTRGDPVHVSYELRGTEEGYREKVYGTRPVTTSPESLEHSHLAWDLRDTYSTLWTMYGRYVQEEAINNALAVSNLLHHYKADHVFSTIPAPLLCSEPELHQFASQTVWAIGDAPERGIFAPNPLNLNDNQIVCNGEPDVAWYRSAFVLGYHTIEYPAAKRPPIQGGAFLDKPLKTNCDCWPQVKRLGRFGKWQKGILSHEAYEDARRVLTATGHQDPLW